MISQEVFNELRLLQKLGSDDQIDLVVNAALLVKIEDNENVAVFKQRHTHGNILENTRDLPGRLFLFRNLRATLSHLSTNAQLPDDTNYIVVSFAMHSDLNEPTINKVFDTYIKSQTDDDEVISRFQRAYHKYRYGRLLITCDRKRSHVVRLCDE